MLIGNGCCGGFCGGLVVVKLILKFGDYRKGREVRQNGSDRFGGFAWNGLCIVGDLELRSQNLYCGYILLNLSKWCKTRDVG